jgi:hypothetical protein
MTVVQGVAVQHMSDMVHYVSEAVVGGRSMNVYVC